MAWYMAGMGVLIAVFFAIPVLRTVLGAAVGLVSAAAVAYGVLRYRPRRAYAWWFLAAGLLAFATGDTCFSIAGSGGTDAAASTTASDIAYLAMFPLIGMGLLGLTRATTAARDRSSLLDSLIFTTAVAFLLWIFLVGPYLTAPETSPFERSSMAAYALADVLVLATTVRLLSAVRGNIAAILLVAGATGMLVADLFFGAALLEGGWRAGGPVELGWFALYVAWGAAALHPSMVALTQPAEPYQAEVGWVRLMLLGAAAVIAPAVLLLQAVTGRVHDTAVIGVVSGVTFVLVLSRLADASDAHRLAVARERILREAGAALVSAARADEVDRAVRAAVERLVPPYAAHRVIFTVNQADGVPAAAVSIWGPSVVAISGLHSAPSSAAVRRTRVLRVRTLQPALVEQLRLFESAVLCPLVLDERAAGVARVGALLVAADDAVLSALRDSLEVLAAQVALALERIGLSQEISRRDSDEYFRSLVQNTADVILIVEDEDQIRYASPSVAAVLGIEPAACTRLRSVVHPDEESSVADLLESIRANPQRRGEWYDWSVRRPDGERVDLEVTCLDLRRDRAVRGLVFTMRDVTERRRLERELTHRAVHDALTGLANRVSFHDQVHEAVERARDGGRTVGTLSIDLDEFATVNDSYGHAAGDALLVATGQRLRAIAGETATVARLGGDEFAVLVPDADGPERAERIAEHLVGALAEQIALGEVVVTPSVSIGVATTADATDAGELLQRADLALYVAKGAGKGRWCRYQTALHTAVVERLELRAALAEAVEKRHFVVEYQPIVDLAGGAAVGFEALVRWQHPVRGVIPPEQFIALAEETGLIEPIGDWVLQQAVVAAARWHADTPGRTGPYVSVNVSGRQLRTAGFVAKVRGVLATAEVRPEFVMLEITESLLLRDDERVWSELAELRAMGLRVAIDDFGTGFSSLSYLQKMPADVLKLDRSFTATAASSRRQRLLLEGIVRLADTLGLDTIAEGVETEAARVLLADMGCASGQGYFFSRPLSDSDVLTWLRNGHQAKPAGLAVAATAPPREADPEPAAAPEPELELAAPPEPAAGPGQKAAAQKAASPHKAAGQKAPPGRKAAPAKKSTPPQPTAPVQRAAS
jgi:diguanylate cyclase (GGDEF)-like protein/PAS domain S-box-containing protein